MPHATLPRGRVRSKDKHTATRREALPLIVYPETIASATAAPSTAPTATCALGGAA